MMPAIIPPRRLVVVDRSSPFKPSEVFGVGWDYWRGSKKGNGLKGNPETDRRLLSVSEFDLGQIEFKDFIPEGGVVVSGEARRKVILGSEFIGLDPKLGQMFYDEPGRKVLRWFRQVRGIKCLEFTGETLRSPDGHRCFLCLRWFRLGGWFRMFARLDTNRDSYTMAAVIPANLQKLQR
jgi:hypothetical protein